MRRRITELKWIKQIEVTRDGEQDGEQDGGEKGWKAAKTKLESWVKEGFETKVEMDSVVTRSNPIIASPSSSSRASSAPAAFAGLCSSDQLYFEWLDSHHEYLSSQVSSLQQLQQINQTRKLLTKLQSKFDSNTGADGGIATVGSGTGTDGTKTKASNDMMVKMIWETLNEEQRAALGALVNKSGSAKKK